MTVCVGFGIIFSKLFFIFPTYFQLGLLGESGLKKELLSSPNDCVELMNVKKMGDHGILLLSLSPCVCE